jgi:hypothetical protein
MGHVGMWNMEMNVEWVLTMGTRIINVRTHERIGALLKRMNERISPIG